MAAFEPPSWSAAPSESFKLEVLKDGKIIEEVKLEEKEYFILGRQPDVVDILMEHPSISRRHAVLNFRDDGALMLFDFEVKRLLVVNKAIGNSPSSSPLEYQNRAPKERTLTKRNVN